MALAILFTPPSMDAAKYDEAIRRLNEAGAGNPDGRLYHACYGNGNGLRVLDVWESAESFERFGETLMPILADIGLDPGEPEVTPLHNTIVP